jgi:hypothetical protein
MRIIGIVSLLVALTTTVHGQAARSGSVGTVRLPQQVMVDGATLPAGTYELRLSGGGDPPTIEFVQKGQVRASTLAIVPPENAKFPAGTHAQRVRNDDDPYVRVTISRGGQHYLAYLPAGR